MSAARQVERVVVVHGPASAALEAILHAEGLEPAFSTAAATVWASDESEPAGAAVTARTPGAGPGACAGERLLLSIPQAAAALGVGRTTAYQLIQHGDLPVVHVGRCARVPADAIRELVEAWRAGAPTGHSRLSRVGGRIRSVGCPDTSQPGAARTAKPRLSAPADPQGEP